MNLVIVARFSPARQRFRLIMSLGLGPLIALLMLWGARFVGWDTAQAADRKQQMAN